MKPTDKQIEEIAGDLECGMRCYFNTKTGVIKTIINFDSWAGADEELWEEDMKEIEDNWDDYIELEAMESHDSFRMMADFAENIDNSVLQEKLINALNRSKPFRNFKWIIDNSGDYREEWFAFKKQRFIEWVKEQLEFKFDDTDE